MIPLKSKSIYNISRKRAAQRIYIYTLNQPSLSKKSSYSTFSEESSLFLFSSLDEVKEFASPLLYVKYIYLLLIKLNKKIFIYQFQVLMLVFY